MCVFPACDVRCKNRAAQPVFGIVGESDGFILVGDAKEQGHGTEKFFDISGSALFNVREDRRLHKRAGAIEPASAQHETRSGGHRALYLIDKIEQRRL